MVLASVAHQQLISSDISSEEISEIRLSQDVAI